MSDTAASGARIGSGTAAAAALPAGFALIALVLPLAAPSLFAALGFMRWSDAFAPLPAAVSAGVALLAAGLIVSSCSRSAYANTTVSIMAAAAAALSLIALILTSYSAGSAFFAPSSAMHAGEHGPHASQGSPIVCAALFFLASTALCHYAATPAKVSPRGVLGHILCGLGQWAGRLGFGIAFFLFMSNVFEDDVSELVTSLATISPVTALAFTALFIGLAPARKDATLNTLASFIMIGMMVPLAALMFHFVEDDRAMRLTHALNNLTATANRLADQRQEIFENTRALLTALTRAPEIAAPGDACDIYLAQTALYQPWVKHLGVVNSSGEIVCTSGDAQFKGASIAHRSYFQEAQRTRHFTLSEVVMAVTGKYQIVEAMPVDPQSDASPLILALLDPVSFGEGSASSGLDPGAEAIFVDRTGTLIARFPGNPDQAGTSLASEKFVQMALGKESAVFEATDSNGVQKLYASRTLASGAGVIILAKDRQAAVGQVDTELGMHLALSAAILVLMLLLGYVVAQVLIFTPLRRLSDFSQQLEEGDFQARLPIRPRGEIGGVCRALDHMATALEEREANLKATRALFESVFNTSRDCIYISKCNDDGQIYLALTNGAAAKAASLLPEQMMGKTYHELYGEAGGETMAGDIRRVMARGLPMEFEYHQEDTDQYWEGIHFPLQGVSGRIDSVFTSLNETTSRKRVDRMKSEFIATVSHELRTPLTSIAGALGLIIGGTAGQVGEKAAKLLRIAHQNAIRLVRLVNDILDIEKIEAGQMEFNIKPVDLNNAVELSLGSLTAFAQNYGVQMRFDNHGLKPVVSADEDRLVQVITNIVSNAIKFSPKGETVAVELRGSGRRDLARVTVIDRGPGIPAAFQPRVFMKFCQADSSDTRSKGGTGLGLSICKELVERLGGRISFETTEGAGTSFHVDMPLAQAAAPAKPAPQQKKAG